MPPLQMEVALAQPNFALQPPYVGNPYSAANAASQAGSPEPLTNLQNSPYSSDTLKLNGPNTFRLDGDGPRSPLIKRESGVAMAPSRAPGGSAAGSQTAKMHQHHVAAALSKKMNTTQERQQLEKLAAEDRKRKHHDIHERKDGGKAAELGVDGATVATGVVVTAGTVLLVTSAIFMDLKGGREPELSPPESRLHPLYRSRMGI
jgi:hypothetical protein